MDYIPDFKLLANDKDVTETIRPFFHSLTITDEGGVKSDRCVLVLVNNDDQARLTLPPEDAKLTVYMGYKNNLRRMGRFVLSKTSLAYGANSVERITLSATGISLSQGEFGSLQEKKQRSFDSTTFGRIADQIAVDNKLKLAIDKNLSATPITHVDQLDESDLNLLNRLCRRLDAAVKVNEGVLAIIKKGKGLTASGKNLPVVSIVRTSEDSCTASFPVRDLFKSVVAVWRDKAAARDVVVKVGSGSPVHRLKGVFDSGSEAREMAESTLKRIVRGKGELQASIKGNAAVVAEGRVRMSGYNNRMDDEWTNKNVTHKLDSSGFKTTFSAELLE